MEKTSLDIRRSKNLGVSLIQAVISNYKYLRLTYKNVFSALLANHEHRSLLATMFIAYIKKYYTKFNPEFVIGKSPLGIAIATAVAKRFKTGVVIDIDGNYCQFKSDLSFDGIELSMLRNLNPDVVIAISLETIPSASQLANDLGIGFAFVDVKSPNRVVGILKPGMKYVLFGEGKDLTEIGKVELLLRALGLQCSRKFHNYPEFHETCLEERFGKSAIIIGDVYFTGAGATKEVWSACGAGFNVGHCFAVYSSELADSIPCTFDSLLEHSLLMEMAKDSYMISQNTKGLLRRIMVIVRKDAMKYFVKK